MILVFINIMLAIIPALFLVIFFYKQDKRKKEPPILIWKTFIIGFFAVIPAALIEGFLKPFSLLSGYYQNLFVKAFIVAALVEEGLKFAVVKLYIYPQKDFDEITDGIIYAITASLGFACFENILYSTGGIGTVLLRGVTAVPLHAIASGIMGYYIGYSKFMNRDNMIKGLLAATLIHGSYDFLLFTHSGLSFLVIPLLIVCGFILKKLLNTAISLDEKNEKFI
ncbi:MAG: PrsW family glutamic-type intramembrane protease [Spirochaetales bacterium]|nr:PrsW family glutamic-type intramembrane protease [Spirochaetales bacterium]